MNVAAEVCANECCAARLRFACVRGLCGWLLLLLPATWAAAQDVAPSLEVVKAAAAAARDDNDVPRAVALYGRALQMDAAWADGWRNLGMLEYSQDAYPEARDALSHYIELMPRVGMARALRGLCEFETADYAQSLKDIQDGLAAGAANDPRNVPILRSREALLLTREGMFEAALKSYGLMARAAGGQTAGQNPGALNAATQTGPDREMLVAIGLAGLRSALLPKDVPPQEQELYAAAGRAAFQFMSGDERGAAGSFAELFRQYPDAKNAHYLYGYLVQQSDPDLAIAEFKKELEVSPRNTLATELVAWGLLMEDNAARALPYAEEAGKEQPASPVAQVVLGRSLVETGDIKDGVQHLEEAQQIDPQNVEVHIALAEAYSKEGHADDALRERMKCLRMIGKTGGAD